MKHFFFSIVLFSLCWGWDGSVGAQTVQESNPGAGSGLTLTGAIQEALARNRDLAVVQTELEISRGRLRQARTYPHNPELILEGDAGRGTGREDSSDRRGLWGTRIGLGQVVEIRGQQGFRSQVAESDTARTEWEVQEAEREVVSATMRAFSELLIAQERLALTREMLDLFTRLKSTAEDLARAGAVPELDALRAEVERRRVATRLTLEEGALAAAKGNLGLLIGAPQGFPFRVTGLLLYEPLKGGPQELVATARSRRPDLKAEEAALQSAAASLRLIRAERVLPLVTLSAFYSRGADYDAYNQRGILGFSVPLPLVNRREGDLAAAEAAVRRGEAQRARVLARIDKEVFTTYETYSAGQKVVKEFAERIVPAHEENVRLIEQGYRLGELRLTDALLAQRDLFETRSASLEVIAAHNRALTELYWATGVRP
jgi:outer membrane protein, heavy metal efflux system